MSHLQFVYLLYDYTLIINIWMIKLDGYIFDDILDLSCCVIHILMQITATVGD